MLKGGLSAGFDDGVIKLSDPKYSPAFVQVKNFTYMQILAPFSEKEVYNSGDIWIPTKKSQVLAVINTTEYYRLTFELKITGPVTQDWGSIIWLTKNSLESQADATASLP